MVVPMALAILIVWFATLVLFFAAGKLLIRSGLWPREWEHSTGHLTEPPTRQKST
jgi:hypothetical protein